MNDRELLEMAAKASGVSGRFIEETPEDGYPRYRYGIGKVGAVTTMWNPLTDDGDALRLAVALGMRVCIYPGQFGAYSIAETDKAKKPKGWAKVTHGSNPGRATRIAIVHAAAEIWRAMP